MSKTDNVKGYSKTSINWFPGHMAKARRMMEDSLKIVDLVIEIIDARIPISSRNPEIDKLAKNKARLIILNKADMADNSVNLEWVSYYKKNNIDCILIDSKTKKGIKDINKVITLVCKDKIERDRRRGILNRPVRAMVVGIPNVGKSTFINSYSGKACTKTGNKPGVTKGKQWIKLSSTLELLDTPGILWPKFEDEKVGINLALTGAINDDILNIDDLALELIKFMRTNYSNALIERYGITINTDDSDVTILEAIATKRGCIKKGNMIDYEKASNMLIDDFRAVKISRITLERP